MKSLHRRWMRAVRTLGLTVLLPVSPLVKVSAAADRNQNWVEVRSPHFVVFSNAGEKDGRHVAMQFENIRAMFRLAFPKLRVDPGKPTIIFALRNEDSLKIFLPSYGLNPNATKLAGLFSAHTDMNFALVRMDASSTAENEFHALYHEYTHSLLRMNYRGLPLWLDEGLAEFYGNTRFLGKDANFGMVQRTQLILLQREALLPLATLVSTDYTSPLYNAREHTGIFYAESWALVHYLMLSEDVKGQGLLDKFLAALQATDDPVEAARQSFGDLKKLADKLNAYARQATFTYAHLPVTTGLDEKEFTARPLPQAEAFTQQANFLLRGGHSSEALSLLHQAQDADAQAQGLHDALGYYHFLRADYENAAKEYNHALELNGRDAMAHYYLAEILYRQHGYNTQNTALIRSELEKAVALDANFAPSHAFLCIVDTQEDATKVKSIAEAKAAIALEPGNLAYYIDLGRAALANGKTEDAKTISERAQKAATTPRDRAMASTFARRVLSNAPMPGSVLDTDAGQAPSAPFDDAKNLGETERTTVEGQISELICGKAPEVLLTLTMAKEQMLLHVTDIGKLPVLLNGQAATAVAIPCSQWKDRKARVTFSGTPDGPAHGEIRSIEFL